MNITRAYYGLANISKNISETISTINRDGLKNTTENLFHKLQYDNIDHLKKTELKGVEAAENRYKAYETVLSEIKKSLEQFKIKSMQKITDGTNDSQKNDINKELQEIKKHIESLIDYKINGEKIFSNESELFVGENIRTIRTFDESYMFFNGEKMGFVLDEVISDTNTNFSKIDELSSFISMRETEIGAKRNSMQSLKRLYENTILNNDEFMLKRKNMTEAIQELNDSQLSYEAMSKIIARMSGLSLVNYV